MKIFNKIVAAALLSMTMLSGNMVLAADIELSQIQSQNKVPLKLYVLDCGAMELRDGSVMSANLAKGSVVQLVNACYLISHPSGYFLWDAGLPDMVADAVDGVEISGGLFLMNLKKTLAAQLAELEVSPDDIGLLGFSHLHSDHTGNAKLFNNAKWLVQENEYDFAFGENAASASFAIADYGHLKDKAQKLNGHYDVFGDGSVVIVSTPGHTIGHQVLFVNLTDTKPVVLSGDLYTSTTAVHDHSMPVWNYNVEQTKQSFELVEGLLEQTGAQLWVQHDKAQFESLKKAPFAYE